MIVSQQSSLGTAGWEATRKQIAQAGSFDLLQSDCWMGSTRPRLVSWNDGAIAGMPSQIPFAVVFAWAPELLAREGRHEMK